MEDGETHTSRLSRRRRPAAVDFPMLVVKECRAGNRDAPDSARKGITAELPARPTDRLPTPRLQKPGPGSPQFTSSLWLQYFCTDLRRPLTMLLSAGIGVVMALDH